MTKIPGDSATNSTTETKADGGEGNSTSSSSKNETATADDSEEGKNGTKERSIYDNEFLLSVLFSELGYMVTNLQLTRI